MANDFKSYTVFRKSELSSWGVLYPKDNISHKSYQSHKI
jgi:hypothetical protein